jgi:general secretion pathway protein D
MTAPNNFDRVKQVIEELDRPIPQVLIKVLIAEITHDKSLDVGAEISVLDLSSAARGALLGTDFGVANATGGLVVRGLGNDVNATLRALERNGKLDVLSRPYILASDNQLASITVGQNVPIPSSTRVLDNGDTLSNVDYQPVGILLDVVPHINPDGLVIMDVQPTISALTDSTIQISEQFNAPIINERSAISRVSIENGKTIVIGGLMEDRLNEQLRKVPILGDLPVVGAAFRRIERTKTKTELLIFLTPHVASSPSVLPGMSKDELEGTKILPKAVEPGMYEQHRAGLERGKTNVIPRGGSRTTTMPAAQQYRDDASPTREVPAPSRDAGDPRQPTDASPAEPR